MMKSPFGKLPTFKPQTMQTMGQPLQQSAPAMPQMPNPMAQGLPDMSAFNNKLYPGTQWIMQQPGLTGGMPNPAAVSGPAQMPQQPQMQPMMGHGEAREAWHDQKPQWQGFDGSRQDFRDARMDWRQMRPNFHGGGY